MNDKFLYQLREEPKPEFVKGLHQKLIESLPTKLGQDAKAGTFPNRQFLRQMILVMVAVIITFVLAIAISPAVRAAVTGIIETIIVRGTTVWVSDDVPAVSGEGETYTEIWTPVSPSELSTDYPFFAKFPTWVPSGFVLQERAALYGSMHYNERVSAVLVEWKNKSGETIQLNVRKGSCPNGRFWDTGDLRSDCTIGSYFSVGVESQPEILSVNDRPAVLIPDLLFLADLSGPVQQWNPSRSKYNNQDHEAFFLIWENDGRTFTIATQSRKISKEEIIHMAQSIP